MEFTITSSPDFVIRSLTTAAEIEAFYWLNAQVSPSKRRITCPGDPGDRPIRITQSEKATEDP